MAGRQGGGCVPRGFSVLYTNFPYRTFSVTNCRGNFTSAEKALFFSVRRVMRGRGPGIIFLRGIGGLISRSGKGAFGAVVRALRRGLNCGAFTGILGSTARTGIPRGHRQVFVITFSPGRIGGCSGFRFPGPVGLAGAVRSFLSGRGRSSVFCCGGSRRCCPRLTGAVVSGSAICR